MRTAIRTPGPSLRVTRMDQCLRWNFVCSCCPDYAASLGASSAMPTQFAGCFLWDKCVESNNEDKMVIGQFMFVGNHASEVILPVSANCLFITYSVTEGKKKASKEPFTTHVSPANKRVPSATSSRFQPKVSRGTSQMGEL